MSQLAGLLRQITRKSSNPNAFVYQVQLERARQKYLVRGELDDGKASAVALGAPEDGDGSEREREREATAAAAAVEEDKKHQIEAAEPDSEGAKNGGAENKPI